MERLANRGANIHTRNFHGDTALHITAMMSRIDLSILLLNRNVSIHARNAADRTPFQNVLTRSPELVSIFLADGRVNIPDDFGSSPLHIAVQERVPLSIINSIVDKGSRLSSVDSDGRTPVRLAVDTNSPEAARFLANSGSDVFYAARDGRSAAEVALFNGEEMIRALFTGNTVHARDTSGNSILHYAARQGDTSVIALLLALGAQSDVRNIAQETPLEIALRWRNNDAAVLLN